MSINAYLKWFDCKSDDTKWFNDLIKKYSPEYFSTKIHTSKKIETDVKVYPAKECYWNELQLVLHTQIKSTHALVIKQGTICNLDFFPEDKPHTTVFCSPGLEPVKVGPIS